MKLLQALLESINESKPITLDDSVIPQIEALYDKFISNMKSQKKPILRSLSKGGKLKLGRVNFKSPYDPNFKGVDAYAVYVTYPPGYSTPAYAVYNRREKIILINIYEKKLYSKDFFMDTVYHELVHAIDPKINKSDVGDKLLQSQMTSRDQSHPFLQYLKKPTEFDAFSSSFINNLSRHIENLKSEELKKEAKTAIRNVINKLLSFQKNITPTGNVDFSNQRIYGDPGDAISSRNNNLLELLEELLDISKTLYNNILKGKISYNIFKQVYINIIFYMQKPTLFKKYIQRLSTLL